MHWFHHDASHHEIPETLRDTVVAKYLNGQKTLEQALDAFSRPVEDKFMNTTKSELVEPLLMEGWNTIIAIASATPHTSANRQKLADFVVALQYRPTLMKGEYTCQLDDAKVWKELPAFNVQMRDAWNMAPSADSDENHQKAWINLNAFAASLTVASLARNLRTPDYSLYCIWTIRDALEQQEQTPDIAIQAAAICFICAAPTIWTFCTQEKVFQGKLARPGPEFSSREWRGFETDRWTSWEVRFKNIASQNDLNAKTKKLVNDAQAAMKAVG